MNDKIDRHLEELRAIVDKHIEVINIKLDSIEQKTDQIKTKVDECRMINMSDYLSNKK